MSSFGAEAPTGETRATGRLAMGGRGRSGRARTSGAAGSRRLFLTLGQLFTATPPSDMPTYAAPSFAPHQALAAATAAAAAHPALEAHPAPAARRWPHYGH